LIIEYDGRFFSGWQRQPGLPTVQQTLEDALVQLVQQPIVVYGAGRTDKGVHATAQAAHIELTRPFLPESLRRGMNFYMKEKGVVVREVRPVSDTFHARFSATFRAYTYKILNRPSPSVLEEGRVWWVQRPLNLLAMAEGGRLLEGHHDFAAFRAKDCGSARTWRTLDRCDVRQSGEYILFHIKARAFLHEQVRIMVGTLKMIGEGKRPPQDILTMLASKKRACVGPTAPPEGLYLVDVGYDEEDYPEAVSEGVISASQSHKSV
jgi:tRNA pseudouridine38-40 synthase